MYNRSPRTTSRIWTFRVAEARDLLKLDRPTEIKTKLTRRAMLKTGFLSGAALVAGLDGAAWPDLCPSQEIPGKDLSSVGKQLGTVNFIHEGSAQMDSVLGAELDGRLFTDLSALESQHLLTLTEKFYIRTRASELLPDLANWRLNVDGLVDRHQMLALKEFKTAAKPMGAHVMECAGNVRLARYGMISAANWDGVTLSDILENAKVKSQATRVLIEGFDRYASESATSVPGASWMFTLEELKSAGAFLATEMNGQPLSKDHGAPIRLVVPGWYGCTCIKWVTKMMLVDDTAEATSQMREYAGRTMQDGMPRLASGYRPAVIDQAAMPIRIEKWLLQEKVRYRVVGILWGGTRPVKDLQIRFNPDAEYVRVDNLNQVKNDPWTLWTHNWSPKEPGTYTIRLTVNDPVVQTRRLDSGYYARTVEITEV
jgi:DMSO/TMAO reductase YedYZ molybdopterin-dependent catalytic subunit